MNLPSTRLLRALTTLALGAPLLAQNPANPPPWWRVQDDVTVSLAWDFSGPAPLAPSLVVAPSWYNPAVTQMAPTGPLTIVPNLNGHSDVLALVGNGTPRQASIDLTVDNDPHLDWIKIFWFQFDAFEGASGSVLAAIEQDLVKYDRSAVTTKTVSLGQGWSQVTVTAQLIPQPDDEGIDWTFTENAFGSAAIDNLFVNSKCVKVDDTDQDGDAFGIIDGFAIDLNAATSNTQCIAAAVTEGPAPGFARTYWVSALAPVLGSVHQVFQLNQTGGLSSTTLLPDTLAQAPFGASDLAVETVVSPGGVVTAQWVYALIDLRSTVGANVVLRAISSTGVLTPARDVTLSGFPPIPVQRLGLAFNPSGNRGAGTFWVTDQSGNGYEFTRLGALLRTINNLPNGVVGAGYDDIFGNLYWFSSDPVATPSGPVLVNGYEYSAYDLQPTGTRFFGDLTLPNPGGTRGGVATGLEVYRRASGDFRAACVVRLPVQGRSMLYELKGPFRWGASLHGTCGMQGLPFEGSNNFAITLSGVPNATFATLYAGFAARPAPLPLGAFGLHETNVLVSLDMNSTLQLPIAPGEFRFTLPLLGPGSGFSYVPMFFQWLVFDPSVPGGVTLSPGGKTILY